jgi:hypothetical protein
VAHCTSQVREGERDLYLKWFDTARVEFFGGTTPRAWFRERELPDLEWMLGMGRREPEKSAEGGRQGREDGQTRRTQAGHEN